MSRLPYEEECPLCGKLNRGIFPIVVCKRCKVIFDLDEYKRRLRNVENNEEG